MDRDDFEKQLGDWLADVNHEAIRLLDSGIAPEMVLKLAIDVAGARLNTRAMEQAKRLQKFRPQVGSRN